MHRNMPDAAQLTWVISNIRIIPCFLSSQVSEQACFRGGWKERWGFFPQQMLCLKQQRKVSYKDAVNTMFTTTTLSCLSGPIGETESPKSFQPCAGHPEAVQEASREFWVFLEVLRLKLSTDIDATQETGLALKQRYISCTHIKTCKQNKKHHTCIYCMCAYACPGACTHTYTLTYISAVSICSQKEQCHRYDWDKLPGDLMIIYWDIFYVVWNYIYVHTFVKSPWLSNARPNVF